LGLISIST